jgi:beta-lactamase regulating signal transducer with metallopeptidase domain
VACAALGAMLVFTIGTYAYTNASATTQATQLPTEALTESGIVDSLGGGAAVSSANVAPFNADAVLSAGAAEGTELTWLTQAMSMIMPWLALGWIIGVCILSIRLLGGYWLFNGIKQRATHAPSEWQWCVSSISRLMGITRKVSLMVSNRVSVPLVIGWIAPAVILPASAILHLRPEALEAILAHELAHIRRYDYIVNLVQSIVEVLFFYHPATWWLSSQIRELREHCCDDVAVKLCSSPVAYANALANLETLREGLAIPPQLAPAANGASLMKRIQRLLQVSEPTTSGFRAGWFIAVAILTIIGTSSLWAVSINNRNDNQQIQDNKPVQDWPEIKSNGNDSAHDDPTPKATEDGKESSEPKIAVYSNGKAIKIFPLDISKDELEIGGWTLKELDDVTKKVLSQTTVLEALKVTPELLTELEGNIASLSELLSQSKLNSDAVLEKLSEESSGSPSLNARKIKLELSDNVRKLNGNSQKMSSEEKEKIKTDIKVALDELKKLDIILSTHISGPSGIGSIFLNNKSRRENTNIFYCFRADQSEILESLKTRGVRVIGKPNKEFDIAVYDNDTPIGSIMFFDGDMSLNKELNPGFFNQRRTETPDAKKERLEKELKRLQTRVDSLVKELEGLD